MSKKRKRMIVRASKRFGRIHPCGSHIRLAECFSHFSDSLVFWYNTSDGSTHVEMQSAGAVVSETAQ